MSRAVWIDEGTDANEPKLRALQADPYYSHRDPRVSAAYLQGVHTAGFQPGIYSAWNWYPGLTGAQYAEHLHDELLRIGWRGNPALCVDIETHDVAYVQQFLIRWRQLRPTRSTTWTFEGFQGALFETSRAIIVNSKVRLAPQLYRGDMSPLEHSPILDLLISGFPADRIDGMYDAAVLPWRWRGFAFTQQRLP